jgi:hypothetical protein
MKFMLAHLFVKKSYTKFHEYLKDGLVTDTRLEADGQTIFASTWSVQSNKAGTEGLNVGATVILSPF